MSALRPSLGLTVTESVREGLRLISEGVPCPTCGHAPKTGPTHRAISRATGTSPATMSRFLRGAEINSDTLDRLYEFVNERLPRAQP